MIDLLEFFFKERKGGNLIKHPLSCPACLHLSELYQRRGRARSVGPAAPGGTREARTLCLLWCVRVAHCWTEFTGNYGASPPISTPAT